MGRSGEWGEGGGVLVIENRAPVNHKLWGPDKELWLLGMMFYVFTVVFLFSSLLFCGVLNQVSFPFFLKPNNKSWWEIIADGGLKFEFAGVLG